MRRRVVGEGDPAGAIEIMNAMSKSLAKDEAAVSIAGEWAKSDPEAAAQWVETLPLGKAHEFAYRNIANAWSRANPAGASAAWP